jgi:hypothetical protein
VNTADLAQWLHDTGLCQYVEKRRSGVDPRCGMDVADRLLSVFYMERLEGATTAGLDSREINEP